MSLDAPLEQDTAAQSSPTPSPSPSWSATPTPAAGLDLDNDGFSERDGDCDDTRADINPDAPELCGDHVDNDCDRFTDEPSGIGAQIFFADQDGDSFGDPNAWLTSCEPMRGFTDDSSDCDDRNSEINPLAAELCFDEVDSNCDGDLDVGAEDAMLCRPEEGGDAVEMCECPEGWAPADDQ